MDESVIKQPSKKLKQKLDDVVKHFRNCATVVDEAFALGKEEGFSEKEIGLMMREQLKRLGYNPRSIRRALPSSTKDLSKVPRGYLVRNHNNGNDNTDVDKMSSSENSNDFDENRQIRSSNMVMELQAEVKSLKEQLAEEQIKNDLLIQSENELQSLLQDVDDQIRTLILLPEEFPPDSDRVLKYQDDALLVEFKGTEVLEISLTTRQEAYNQFTD
jgi:hypothetical protein